MADQIFPSADNPVPEEAHAGTFSGKGKVQLRYARFAATGRPLKGTVVIFPGRNEAIEKYFETIGELQERGFGVALFDWRGQGGSQRLTKNPRRGYVRSFDDHVGDIDAFVADILLPDCRAPFFLIGHSTGALTALLAAPRLTNRVRRMVLLAPLLTLEKIPVSMTTLRRLTGFFTRIGFGRVFLARRQRTPQRQDFETNIVTSDPVRFARNQAIYAEHPALGLGATTIGWVHAACVAAARVHERAFLRNHRIPTLFVAAGADTLVSTPAVEDYARQLRGASIVTIDGAKHEILQEADRFREQFWAAFDAFIPGEGGDGL
ncbi:alpha/beta fold hydrolase [Aliihoeflea aestuarii]|jgi:lysophospholipase|uniref:alpha/beta fold hydrolase n=1 Tax=Aliihoeflea aestuarii TaxID=453840 RepID=UPI00209385A0|nr:alpha/beta hydrolase [Aliihoeflea aestuarii]MCO6391187.1 alpha/beta fold hydrolase [Aliihoeflea aestuarii]